MQADKIFCASSYLMYRTVVDEEKQFYPGLEINRFHVDFPRDPVSCADDLLDSIKRQMEDWTVDGKAAIALSAGMDSAILAKFMPRGSTAYTFQCIVPGMEVVNEVPQAGKYAEICGLSQKVVPIYWEDYETFTPILARHKGAPFHSIEVQIYKAALQAKEDGYNKLIFGETADANYGGFSGLMSKDWTFGEFVDRYSYVKPYQVLKDYQMPFEPYIKYTLDGYIDAHEFMRNVFLIETMGSYTNACQCAGITMLTPYVHTWMSAPMDYDRERCGDNKYIIREAFKKVYGDDFIVPEKRPMPRATNEWFKEWPGPTRIEFWPHCTDHMTGDQKWLVWCLEKFFDMMESTDKYNF